LPVTPQRHGGEVERAGPDSAPFSPPVLPLKTNRRILEKEEAGNGAFSSLCSLCALLFNNSFVQRCMVKKEGMPETQ
jgi:hypothetical protein